MGFSQQQRVGNWNWSPDPVSALRSQFAVESGKERDRMESSCFNQYDIGEHYVLLCTCVVYLFLYLILKIE